MFSQQFLEALALMLFILNPFLLIIYLIDLVESMEPKRFAKVMLRAGLISGAVYLFFAYFGEDIFKHLFQSNFASFQIFGGFIFLITAIRFVFEGKKAIAALKGGDPEHVEGSVVMPIMIGPGSISASILIGKSLSYTESTAAIVFSMVLCIAAVIGLKYIYDHAHARNEQLVRRYIDLTGRISALLIGTFSIEMIMNGLSVWIKNFMS